MGHTEEVDQASDHPEATASTPSQPGAPRRADLGATARGFKALGDPARLQILSIIAASGDGVCVCDMIPKLGLSQPTVSHHLGVLAAAGLVNRTKRGTWAYYRPNAEAIASLLAQVPI